MAAWFLELGMRCGVLHTFQPENVRGFEDQYFHPLSMISQGRFGRKISAWQLHFAVIWNQIMCYWATDSGCLFLLMMNIHSHYLAWICHVLSCVNVTRNPFLCPLIYVPIILHVSSSAHKTILTSDILYVFALATHFSCLVICNHLLSFYPCHNHSRMWNIPL